jgi:hypothetical protein
VGRKGSVEENSRDREKKRGRGREGEWVRESWQEGVWEGKLKAGSGVRDGEGAVNMYGGSSD